MMTAVVMTAVVMTAAVMTVAEATVAVAARITLNRCMIVIFVAPETG
jgi:hypothetical protein